MVLVPARNPFQYVAHTAQLRNVVFILANGNNTQALELLACVHIKQKLQVPMISKCSRVTCQAKWLCSEKTAKCWLVFGTVLSHSQCCSSLWLLTHVFPSYKKGELGVGLEGEIGETGRVETPRGGCPF